MKEKIIIKLFCDGESTPPYLDLSNSDEYSIKIFKVTDTSEVEIDFSLVEIVVYDNNITVIEDKLYAKELGSCEIGVFYEGFMSKQDFVVYEPWLRDNYAENLLCSFDVVNLQENPHLKVLLDTIMEFFDIYYAYKEDLKHINNPMSIKTKLIDIFGRNKGFERLDLKYKNTSFEGISNNLYRELLLNLIDLLNIRGTKTAYSLFFGALGYNIELSEFWFDDNGYLIEIDPYDDNNSTFYAYHENGLNVDQVDVPHPDPRGKADPENPYNQNQKSKYLRLSIEPQEKYYGQNYKFDNYDRYMITKYLEFLKPQNMEYLLEILKINIKNDEDGIFTNDLIYNLIDNDPDFPFNVVAQGTIDNPGTGGDDGDINPPGNISNLNISVSNKMIILSWENPIDEDFNECEVYYGTNGVANQLFEKTTNTNSIINGLDNNIEYTVKVVSVDFTGNKSDGITAKGVPFDNLVTPNVTGVQIISYLNEIRVTWTPPFISDFRGVEVYIKKEDDEWVFLGEYINSSQLFDLLDENTEYSFRLITVDDNDNRSTGVQISTSTLESGVTYIDNVENVQVTSFAEEMQLSYTTNHISDFNSVLVFYMLAGGTEYIYSGTTNEDFYTIEGLDSDKDYDIKIVSQNDIGDNSSGVVIFASTLDIIPPSEITNLASDIKDDRIIFSWINPTEEDFYYTLITNNNTLEQFIVNQNVATVTIDNLEYDTDYSFTFQTVDLIGNISDGIISLLRTLEDSGQGSDDDDITPPSSDLYNPFYVWQPPEPYGDNPYPPVGLSDNETRMGTWRWKGAQSIVFDVYYNFVERFMVSDSVEMSDTILYKIRWDSNGFFDDPNLFWDKGQMLIDVIKTIELNIFGSKKTELESQELSEEEIKATLIAEYDLYDFEYEQILLAI